ncbi:hypothetical protein BDR07DRAFT_1488668 [Suillus spraguei]|nr:hypothetical protein BDR07DRAFT_1488668 [Suillus spraguei]
MTIVLNDPTWWPVINAFRFSSYFAVASFVVVMYDWALTFGQEVELVWRQRWSLMTVMYLGVRYLGISHTAYVWKAKIWCCANRLSHNQSDRGGQCSDYPANGYGFVIYPVWICIGAVVFAMLWVIIITRLYAMYQQSRKILIFLIVTFLATNIFNVVVAVMVIMHSSAEELILSGTYQCEISYPEYIALLSSLTWIVGTVFEVLALCLAVWIAVKHFRELRRHSTGGIMGDCFTVLIKMHVFYFTSVVGVSCLQLILNLSPTLLMDKFSLEVQLYSGLLQILEVAQMFVLGPRLILSVREYNAKLVADLTQQLA